MKTVKSMEAQSLEADLAEAMALYRRSTRGTIRSLLGNFVKVTTRRQMDLLTRKVPDVKVEAEEEVKVEEVEEVKVEEVEEVEKVKE